MRSCCAASRSCLCAHGFIGDRQAWDFGRFVKTVTYFNEPPSAEKVLQTLADQPAKLIRQLTGQDEVSSLAVGTWLCANSTCLTSCCISLSLALMQEKQSAVLKLLASSSSQASKPNSDVVLVAGERHSTCHASSNMHQANSLSHYQLAFLNTERVRLSRGHGRSWLKSCPDAAAARESCQGTGQG